MFVLFFLPPHLSFKSKKKLRKLAAFSLVFECSHISPDIPNQLTMMIVKVRKSNHIFCKKFMLLCPRKMELNYYWRK